MPMEFYALKTPHNPAKLLLAPVTLLSITDREEPILAGDLDKKGAMFGSWVTRYYCLMKTGDSLKLSYKMKPTDTNVKGEWLLRNFSAHVDDSDASGMRFIIETPDKMVVFRAKSQVDCNQWVQRLSVEAKTLISGHDGRLRKSNECKICKSELSPESTYSCETCRMFMCGSQNCSTTDISMSPVCMECYSKSAGKGDVLMLTIVEGKDLAAFDANGFSDPYVVVKFDGVEHRTKVMSLILFSFLCSFCPSPATKPCDYCRFSQDWAFFLSISFHSTHSIANLYSLVLMSFY